MYYKKSKYNILIPYNNETIIFNSLSGAIGKFNQLTLTKFNKNLLDDNEVELLLKKGILVPTEFDELQKINSDRLEGINNKKKKLFRIWPTSACNAQCYYCFEKGIQAKTMSLSTADKLIEFIDNRLNNYDKLELEWFGGEPLLNGEIIDYIISNLKLICNKKEVSIRSNMISNGSLIDKKIAKRIKNAWGISSIQITLDGYNNDYNSTKNFKDPKKHNFWKVIDAVKFLSLEGVHVSIRMNYDTHNYSSLFELINFLNIELHSYNNINYYIYPVWSSTEQDHEDSFHSNTKADLNLLNLIDLLVQNKMATPREIIKLNYKSFACLAWNKNSFAILPDGQIVKCSEVFNQIIGNIWDGIINEDLYNKWTEATLSKKCESCIYLPICQGGCKASYFNRMPQCFAFKPIIKEILKWYVSILENAK